MEDAQGFGHFLAQADLVAKTHPGPDGGASVASWYLIVTKSIASGAQARRRSDSSWTSSGTRPPSRSSAASWTARPPTNAFSHLAQQGIVAAQHHERHGADRLNEAGSRPSSSPAPCAAPSTRRPREMESGLTILASIGATAPFVGLLGTVWGIYHALLAIGIVGLGHPRQGRRSRSARR